MSKLDKLHQRYKDLMAKEAEAKPHIIKEYFSEEDGCMIREYDDRPPTKHTAIPKSFLEKLLLVPTNE